MGWSAILIVGFIAIAAALLGLWAYRRSAKPMNHEHGRSKARDQASAEHGKSRARDPSSAEHGKSKARSQAEQWGVRIAAPARERACPQARGLLGKEFPIDKKPLLPLPDCPYSHQCECHYIKLFDRRTHDRRSEQERRTAQRFAEAGPPRRSGKDRRRKNHIEWN
jgi:FtsZ-interacting cell division protein ZipA